jgi:hypothetical protein
LRCDRCNRQDTFNTTTGSSLSEEGYHQLRIEPFATTSSVAYSVSKELETYDLCSSCVKEFKDKFMVTKAKWDDDNGIGSA